MLIADSGGTKTTWALMQGEEKFIFHTSGLNPAIKVDLEIETVIFDELIPQLPSKKIDSIYFYGAGCKAWENAARIKKYLQEAFLKTEIFIKTDIEGAGISMFGKESGIIVISGTGSSAGFMMDGILEDIMPSKVYPEGDFGSGCHIGALILADYFNEETPDFIEEVITKHRALSFDELFLQFQNPVKSKMISAKVMRDLNQLIDSDYIQIKAKTSIDVLITQLIEHFGEGLQHIPVKMIGSTAFYFENIFRELLMEIEVELVEVQKNPIEGLITYHKKEL